MFVPSCHDSSWPLTNVPCQQLADIAELRRFGGVPFLSPLPCSRSKSKQQQQEQPRADCLYCGPFHSKVCCQLLPGRYHWWCGMVYLCSFVATFRGGILLRVQQSAIRAFSSKGVREHCLLFLNDPMQCYAIPTKPNTNMQGRCFSCVAGWHVDGRYCNGGCMMVSCGGCCPSVCCFLSTHMCSFWHFVRIPCNVDIIGYLLSGSLLVSQPFCQPFTPNSKTVPSEQIYTRKY